MQTQYRTVEKTPGIMTDPGLSRGEEEDNSELLFV